MFQPFQKYFISQGAPVARRNSPQSGSHHKPTWLWQHLCMEEKVLLFHMHGLCCSPLLPLKRKRWDFAKVEDEGHGFICDFTPVPVRKLILKCAWLDISFYKKKLTYHLKH